MFAGNRQIFQNYDYVFISFILVVVATLRDRDIAETLLALLEIQSFSEVK